MTAGIRLMDAPTSPDQREQWLAARAQGIGASEIATVLGLSPWDSPFSLYWRKKLNTQVDMNEAMEWGLRHEQAIAEKFAENHPDLTVHGGGLYQHPEHTWMLATPDRLAYDHVCIQTLYPDADDWGACTGCRPIALLQIKTGYSWDDWGDPGTDQIPLYYRAQVQQEMAVYGANAAWLPVLVGGNSYREYLVHRDDEDIATIVKAGAEFMRRLADDDPPDIDGSAATTKTIKELHPSLIDEPITVPLDLADQYRARKELLDDAKAAYDEVYNQLLDAVGDYRYAVADGRKLAVRQVYDQTRLSTKRLKAEQPDLAERLYAEYGETSTVCKLTPLKES